MGTKHDGTNVVGGRTELPFAPMAAVTGLFQPSPSGPVASLNTQQ